MLGGCDKLGSFFGDAKEKGSEFVQSIEAKTDGGSVGMLLPDFTKLVELEGPSVVNIQATKNAPAASARMCSSILRRLRTVLSSSPGRASRASMAFNCLRGSIW